MTKEQAIEAMRRGDKVRHRVFMDNEWITMRGGVYVLEDGVRVSPKEFWIWRTEDWWDDGWEIVQSRRFLTNETF